jgi:hypothetical protein
MIKILSRYMNSTIFNYIVKLESRVNALEIQNKSITNSLYELESRLQKNIDKIQPVVYNIVNKE